MTCDHDKFAAKVAVHKNADGPGDVTYAATITVKCEFCGKPFEFVGLPEGFSDERPTVDKTKKELRAPLQESGASLLPGVLKKSVTLQ